MSPRPLAVVLVTLIVAALTGCGASDGGTTTVVTVIQKDTSASGAADAAPSTSDDDLVSDEGTADDRSGGKIVVPDEVGKNHQAAQDDLQAHGLYNLAEEDATGQGRMLVLDRNWKVVSQSPAPGTKVADDATIVLRSKKYTD
jgi:beta-lactam-binding protein with PASTA domain